MGCGFIRSLIYSLVTSSRNIHAYAYMHTYDVLFAQIQVQHIFLKGNKSNNLINIFLETLYKFLCLFTAIPLKIFRKCNKNNKSRFFIL